jgi:plastocyanin
MTSIVRLAVVLASALTLAACGGGGDAGGDGDGGGGGLTMVDNAFEPGSLTVSSGDSVDVSNDGEALHNITIADADIDEDVQPGQSTSITIELDPGDYEMICEYHEGQGMTGTVTVE